MERRLGRRRSELHSLTILEREVFGVITPNRTRVYVRLRRLPTEPGHTSRTPRRKLRLMWEVAHLRRQTQSTRVSTVTVTLPGVRQNVQRLTSRCTSSPKEMLVSSHMLCLETLIIS